MSGLTIIIGEINPEPWRSPNLGTKRAGGRIVPIAYKEENLRSYQEALAETVVEMLDERAIKMPVYPKGTELDLSLIFWRQLDSFEAGTARRHVRHQPDSTNLAKATEDALQGILYGNDRDNRRVCSELAAVGVGVTPGVLIDIMPFKGSVFDSFEAAQKIHNTQDPVYFRMVH